MVLIHSLYSQIVMNIILYWFDLFVLWLAINEGEVKEETPWTYHFWQLRVILWVILEIRRVGLHCLCSNCSSISCGSIPEEAPHFLLLKIVRSIFDGAEQIGKWHRVTKEGGRWNKSVCLLNTSRRIFREFLIFFSGGGVACLRHGVTDTL